MKYQTLKAGDIRRKGDEQRETDGRKGEYFYGVSTPGRWTPASLLSHPILAADLCHLSFRRPL